MEAEYKIEEIVELIRDIKERPKPFYGRTTIVWQKGKMIRWEYQGSKKPKDES